MERVGGNPVALDARIGLTSLFFAFLRIGCTSFGGGTAGWLYRDIVQRRGWIDESTYLAGLALGQALPGPNGIKLTVLIGHRLHGAAGAGAALAGLLAGPLAITIGLGATYARFGEHPTVHAVLDGVAAAAVGLTFAAGIHGGLRGAAGLVPLAIGAVTVLCVGVLGWPMLIVIPCLAPVSIALAWVERRRGPGLTK
ncbi:MAG TPA: chromate transporter [Stellaceae bacterium]|nr:chromate transporter [Stellaceae bacterium]